MKNPTTWLPTAAAAAALGRSPDTLKRLMECNGGFLEAGRDYALGPFKNSAICWNIERVRSALHKRGMASRASEAKR